MSKGKKRSGARPGRPQPLRGTKGKRKGARLWYRSEERFSRNAETDLVCRLLLEKKKRHGLARGDCNGSLPRARHPHALDPARRGKPRYRGRGGGGGRGGRRGA